MEKKSSQGGEHASCVFGVSSGCTLSYRSIYACEHVQGREEEKKKKLKNSGVRASKGDYRIERARVCVR